MKNINYEVKPDVSTYGFLLSGVGSYCARVCGDASDKIFGGNNFNKLSVSIQKRDGYIPILLQSDRKGHLRWSRKKNAKRALGCMYTSLEHEIKSKFPDLRKAGARRVIWLKASQI